MTTEWLGGGLMIALAAILWLVYLIPSWFRSRQYLATERNAVRLQQTLRILAETAEVPEEVHVEANARSIAEQERILRHRASRREAEAVPAAVRVAGRLRRSRAVTAGVLALSVAVAVLGGMQAVYTGAWIILIAGVIASAVSVIVLVRLARASRGLRLPRPVASAPVAMPFVDHLADADAGADEVEPADDSADVESPADGWVPVAVPRPLYLGRGSAAPLGLADSSFAPADDTDAADEGAVPVATAAATGGGDGSSATSLAADAHRESLRRAAAEAEGALRARLAVEHATVAELPAPASAAVATATASWSATAPGAATAVAAAAKSTPPAVPSRFARMGIVDDDTASHLDLDAVLARRRAG